KVDLTNLSAIGTYTVDFVISVKNKMHYKAHICLNITPFHGRILFDISHQRDPEGPTIYTFAKLFVDDQFLIHVSFSQITSYSLQFADVLIINHIEKPLTKSEINAIHNWIEDGGFLIVTSGYYNTTCNSTTFDIDSYNALLAPYGIQASNIGIGDRVSDYRPFIGDFYGKEFGGTVSKSPLTSNVSYIYVVRGTALKVNTTRAKSLIMINESYSLMAYAKAGKGVVIAIGDDQLWNESIIAEATIHNASNYQLTKNIADFINPPRPVVYPLWICNLEHTNCTLILFAFSQNGPVNVTMSIKHLFSGWTNTDIAPESDGFVFVINLPQSTFSYDVILTITDPKGITRLLYITVEGKMSFTYLMIAVAVFALIGIGAFLIFKKWKKMLNPPYTK
ncbi:MAG: hypothetical protein J7L47_01140, partial [Candidatus Odinarchaeota archaeon]|nr:hypothetical protein [Candidatus Odinarchaeota archaeon]